MTMIIDGTNGGFFPSWTTATRPASPAVGQMGYNTTTGAFDAYTAAGWVSIASSATAPVNGPAFSAYQSTILTLATATFTKILFQTENFDTNNNFASSRFTPTIAGYYQINATVSFSLTVNNSPCFTLLYKNGSSVLWGQSLSSTTAYPTASISTTIYMNGSTDYLEVYGYETSGGYVNIIAQNDYTNFSGFLARSA
jgi:hypothetical protein